MCITVYYYLKRRYMFLLARYHFLNHCSFNFLVNVGETRFFYFCWLHKKKRGKFSKRMDQTKMKLWYRGKEVLIN